MDIQLIETDKNQYLELLLLADEQESMIDKYLDRGDLFALYDGGLKSVCVVTYEQDGVYELKNLATYEQYQRQGYGRALIDYVFDYYKGKCKAMLVGTGDSPMTIPFYQECGFEFSHIVPNFFIDNYNHPVFDGDKQLIDMVYLRKEFF